VADRESADEPDIDADYGGWLADQPPRNYARPERNDRYLDQIWSLETIDEARRSGESI